MSYREVKTVPNGAMRRALSGAGNPAEPCGTRSATNQEPAGPKQLGQAAIRLGLTRSSAGIFQASLIL